MSLLVSWLEPDDLLSFSWLEKMLANRRGILCPTYSTAHWSFPCLPRTWMHMQSTFGLKGRSMQSQPCHASSYPCVAMMPCHVLCQPRPSFAWNGSWALQASTLEECWNPSSFCPSESYLNVIDLWFCCLRKRTFRVSAQLAANLTNALLHSAHNQQLWSNMSAHPIILIVVLLVLWLLLVLAAAAAA